VSQRGSFMDNLVHSGRSVVCPEPPEGDFDIVVALSFQIWQSPHHETLVLTGLNEWHAYRRKSDFLSDKDDNPLCYRHGYQRRQDVVAAALLALLRRDGVDAVPMKPVQTGCRRRRCRIGSARLEFCLAAAGVERPNPSAP